MLLHVSTNQHIDSILKDPPHALMLSGPLGSGKVFVATSIITQILDISQERLRVYPYFRHLKPLNGTLTIDQIRGLNSFLSLKTVGQSGIKRAVLLEDAHTMNLEAQNAILKLLEEPPADTVIILTALEQKTLKPTVYSRVQEIRVLPVALDDAVSYFSAKGYTNPEITSFFHISNGAVGLMHSLLSGDDNNQLVSNITLAKQLLKQSAYERLTYVDQLTKKPEEVELLLFALKRISTAALEQAAIKQQIPLVRRWSQTLQAVMHTSEAFHANANRKLLLTNLFVNL